jgi:predicted secreted Zn-dependent protease
MATQMKCFSKAAWMAWIVFGLLAASSAAAQVLKWTDSEGHVHYGYQTPDGVATTKVATPPPGITTSQDVEVEETEYRYFEVNGTTVEELNRGRQAFGPSAISVRDGKPFKSWATCGWHMNWNVTRSIKDDGKCHIDKFKLKLGTTITFPKWVNKSEGSPELQKKWDTFTRVVHTHELGHKQNDVRAANEMAVELHKLPAQKDCLSVDGRVRDTFEHLKTKYKILNQAWDQAQVNGSEEDYVLR